MNKSILLIAVLIISISSCKKEDSTDDPTGGTPIINVDDSIIAKNTSELVTSLNGFRFEAAFENTEPVVYPFLWVQYIDDYYDSARVVVLNQNSDKTMTKYLCSNHYNGNVTRSFDHITFPNGVVNSIDFAFNHPQFLLQWWNRAGGEITTVGQLFGFNTSTSQIFTGMLPQYKAEFRDRYLIRYISGISLWPFQYGSWSDQPQFIATQELSEPFAYDHWYDESWSVFPYSVQANMFSGFFNTTPASTYVGVAQGSITLDTIYLNNNLPSNYSLNLCHAYLDKVGDTLYLGTITNLPGLTSQEYSLFKFIIGVNQLEKVYEHFPYNFSAQNVIFKRGSFYVIPLAGGTLEQINPAGLNSSITLPVSTYAKEIKFSNNKMYVVVSDISTRKRVEVYSKDL